MIAYTFFMTERIARLPILELPFLKDSPYVSFMSLSFQKHRLHDYEENEPVHSYCTLIVRKNLTVVLKGRDS